MPQSDLCRIIVVSSEAYRPIQEIWRRCFAVFWPDCQLAVTVVSPTEDVGWNGNLIKALDTVTEELVLLMLEDHFFSPLSAGQYTRNLGFAVGLMRSNDEIGLMKLQGPNAAQPDLPLSGRWFCEYDRAHHPFKRTNLVPTLFRTEYLRRLSAAVLENCGKDRDIGRLGAIEFEVTGTLLTEDAEQWPERMWGIDRSRDIDLSFIKCIASDGVREGKLKSETLVELKTVGIEFEDIPGIERFL